VLAFAAACGLGSVYGFFAGAWPFGLVEAVWALIGLRRWRQRVGGDFRRDLLDRMHSLGRCCNVTRMRLSSCSIRKIEKAAAFGFHPDEFADPGRCGRATT